MTAHPDRDFSQPFQLEQTLLRGRLVRIGNSVTRIIDRHNYPLQVNELLSEMLVLASAFAGSLKFKGRFSLQVRGQGAIKLMVADCTNEGELRGYASFEAEDLAGKSGLELFGQAVFAIVVDQSEAGSETYQGIVELNPKGLTHSLRGYFWRSEQVPTGLRIATFQDPSSGSWNAAALIIQSLPLESDEPGTSADHQVHEDSEAWQRTMILMETVRDEELLSGVEQPSALIWKVFHEDGVRVFDQLDISPACRCSAEKVDTVLATFTKDDLMAMKMDDGGIVVTCEFCGEEYRYDKAKVSALMSRHTH